MKRKGIVIVLVITLLATIVVAASGVIDVFVPGKITEQAEIPVSEVLPHTTDEAMYALLQEIYEGEKLWEMTEQYAYFIATDKPTQEEVNAVFYATEKTSNLEVALAVYRFWENTNDGISVYLRIMDSYTPIASNTEYWYEDVYNEQNGNAHGVLDVDGVNYYLNAGVSAEDIAVANVLSRRGIYTISEILDERKEGKSWAYIADDIFGDYVYNSSHDNILGITVIDAAYLEKRTDKTMSDYFDIAAEEGSLIMERQKYFARETAGIREKLIEQGLWDYSEEEKLNMEIRRQGIMQIAQENGVSREEFAELEAKGVSEIDILNASLVASEKGVTLEQAVTELIPQEGVVDR